MLRVQVQIHLQDQTLGVHGPAEHTTETHLMALMTRAHIIARAWMKILRTAASCTPDFAARGDTPAEMGAL